jgi:hypothetical protein
MTLHSIMTEKGYHLENTCRESRKTYNCGARLCYYKVSIHDVCLMPKQPKTSGGK